MPPALIDQGSNTTCRSWPLKLANSSFQPQINRFLPFWDCPDFCPKPNLADCQRRGHCLIRGAIHLVVLIPRRWSWAQTLRAAGESLTGAGAVCSTGREDAHLHDSEMDWCEAGRSASWHTWHAATPTTAGTSTLIATFSAMGHGRPRAPT